jgi:hypothetical protein
MPEEDFHDTMNHQGLVEPTTYVSSAPQTSGAEVTETESLARLNRSLRRLYTWFGLLTGLSVISIGLLAGTAAWLKQENDQLAQQVKTLKDSTAQVARIGTLESRVASLENQSKAFGQNQVVLNQQVGKALPAQLRVIESRLSSLQIAQNALQKSAATRDQVNEALRALQSQSATTNYNPQYPQYPPTTERRTEDRGRRSEGGNGGL